MAIALMVGVVYTSTMELIKQKKIDLNGLGQEQELRPTPKGKSELSSTPQQSKPKDINTSELESEQAQTAPGCSTPPGGGPAVTSDFKPC